MTTNTMKNNINRNTSTTTKKRQRPPGKCRSSMVSTAYVAAAATASIIWGSPILEMGNNNNHFGQFVEAASSSSISKIHFHSLRGTPLSSSSSSSSSNNGNRKSSQSLDDYRPVRQMVRNVFELEDLDTIIGPPEVYDSMPGSSEGSSSSLLLTRVHTTNGSPPPTTKPSLYYRFYTPSTLPSQTPSASPTQTSSASPTRSPTMEPSPFPTPSPTNKPTTLPPTTTQPTVKPKTTATTAISMEPTIESMPNIGFATSPTNSYSEDTPSVAPTITPTTLFFVIIPFPSYQLNLILEEEEELLSSEATTTTASQIASEKSLLLERMDDLKDELRLVLTDYMEQDIQEAFSDDVQIDLNVEELRNGQGRFLEKEASIAGTRFLEEEASIGTATITVSSSFTVNGSAVFPSSSIGDILTQEDLSQDVQAIVDEILDGPSSQIKLVEYLKVHPQSNILRKTQDASATILEKQQQLENNQEQQGAQNDENGSLNQNNSDTNNGKEEKEPPTILQMVFGFLIAGLGVAGLLFYLHIWCKKRRKRAKRKREHQTIIGGSVKKKKGYKKHSGSNATTTPSNNKNNMSLSGSGSRPSFMIPHQQQYPDAPGDVSGKHPSQDADSSSAEAQSNTDSTSTGEDSFAKELKKAASMDRRVWDDFEQTKTISKLEGRLITETKRNHPPGYKQQIRQHQAKLSKYNEETFQPYGNKNNDDDEAEAEEEGIEILQYSESASVYSLGSSRMGSFLTPAASSGTSRSGGSTRGSGGGMSSVAKYSSFPYGDEESTAVDSGIEVTAAAAAGVGVAGVAGIGLYNNAQRKDSSSSRKIPVQQKEPPQQQRNSAMTRDAPLGDANTATESVSDFTPYNHGWSDTSTVSGSNNIATSHRKYPADPAGVRASSLMSGTDAAAALMARQHNSSNIASSNNANARMSPVIMAPEFSEEEEESHDSESLLTSEIVREVQLLSKFVKRYQKKRDHQDSKKMERHNQSADSRSSSGYDSLSESAKARRLMRGGGSAVGVSALSPVHESYAKTSRPVRLPLETESTEDSDDESAIFFASSSSTGSSELSLANEEMSNTDSDNSRLGIDPFTIPNLNNIAGASMEGQQRHQPQSIMEEKKDNYGRTSQAQPRPFTSAGSGQPQQSAPPASRTINTPNSQVARPSRAMLPASRNHEVPQPNAPPLSQPQSQQTRQQQSRQQQVNAPRDVRKDPLQKDNTVGNTAKLSREESLKAPEQKVTNNHGTSISSSARERLRSRLMSKMGMQKKDPTPQASQTVPSKPPPQQQQQVSQEPSYKRGDEDKPTMMSRQTIGNDRSYDNSARRSEAPKISSKLSALRNAEAIIDNNDSEVNFPVGASLSPPGSPPRGSATQKFRKLASNPARNEANEPIAASRTQSAFQPKNSPQKSTLLRRETNPPPEPQRPVPARNPITVSSRMLNHASNPLSRKSREPYASRPQSNNIPTRNPSLVRQQGQGQDQERRPPSRALPESAGRALRQTNTSAPRTQSQPPSMNASQPQLHQQPRQQQQLQGQGSGRARVQTQRVNTSQNPPTAQPSTDKPTGKFSNIVSMFEKKPKNSIFPPGESWQFNY